MQGFLLDHSQKAGGGFTWQPDSESFLEPKEQEEGQNGEIVWQPEWQNFLKPEQQEEGLGGDRGRRLEPELFMARPYHLQFSCHSLLDRWNIR
jgi:hypothetical protein